jgi:hemerythrin
MSSLFTDRLLIHVEKIDEQHKKIFEILEEYYNVCMNGSSKKKIVEVFYTLRRYMEQHFETEESYMINYNYQGYEEHKEKHNIFMRKFCTIENSFKGNYIPFTKLAESNDFLSEAVVKHISEVDGKLGEFLKDKFQ